jgi:hypothetical protein
LACNADLQELLILWRFWYSLSHLLPAQQIPLNLTLNKVRTERWAEVGGWPKRENAWGLKQQVRCQVGLPENLRGVHLFLVPELRKGKH